VDGPVQGVVKKIGYVRTLPSSHETMSSKAQVVINPKTGLFWVGLDANYSFFLSKERIVAVQPQIGDRLIFIASQERMASANDMNTVEKSLDHKIADYANSHFEGNRIIIRLENYLGEFPFHVVSAAVAPPPKIEGIAVGSDSFTINITGGQDNKVEAAVTFANDFTVTQATLDGKQVFPKSN
jgi:hypothetical protein